MLFYTRGVDTKINGAFANSQDFVTEVLADDHPDVVSWRALRQQVDTDRATRKAALAGEAAADNFIDQLRSATPTQIKNFVTTNVTDLPTARALLVRLAVAVAYALNGGASK